MMRYGYNLSMNVVRGNYRDMSISINGEEEQTQADNTIHFERKWLDCSTVGKELFRLKNE